MGGAPGPRVPVSPAAEVRGPGRPWASSGLFLAAARGHGVEAEPPAAAAFAAAALPGPGVQLRPSAPDPQHLAFQECSRSRCGAGVCAARPRGWGGPPPTAPSCWEPGGGPSAASPASFPAAAAPRVLDPPPRHCCILDPQRFCDSLSAAPSHCIFHPAADPEQLRPFCSDSSSSGSYAGFCVTSSPFLPLHLTFGARHISPVPST